MRLQEEELIKKLLGVDRFSAVQLHGGDINDVFRLSFNARELVIKLNKANRFPEMFRKELNGLNALRGLGRLKIPEVIKEGEEGDTQYLLLEYIERHDQPSHVFWINFGIGLAEQHQSSNDNFGFRENNYIGALHQSNTYHNKWVDFLIEERFSPQLKLALDNGYIDRQECRQIEKIYAKCEELWPVESPALLHGDLWSGNYLVGPSEQPCLIDPAVYFGHREMDIGMMHLFGGFDGKLFAAYNEVYPLETGWKERIAYNQLYPLMVHLNLFGRGYYNQIASIVKKFG